MRRVPDRENGERTQGWPKTGGEEKGEGILVPPSNNTEERCALSQLRRGGENRGEGSDNQGVEGRGCIAENGFQMGKLSCMAPWRTKKIFSSGEMEPVSQAREVKSRVKGTGVCRVSTRDAYGGLEDPREHVPEGVWRSWGEASRSGGGKRGTVGILNRRKDALRLSTLEGEGQTSLMLEREAWRPRSSSAGTLITSEEGRPRLLTRGNGESGGAGKTLLNQVVEKSFLIRCRKGGRRCRTGVVEGFGNCSTWGEEGVGNVLEEFGNPSCTRIRGGRTIRG